MIMKVGISSVEGEVLAFFVYRDFCSAKDKHKCYTVKGSFVQKCVWRKLYYP
jgi:hypothetical protein